jgi:hypothetical protein
MNKLLLSALSGMSTAHLSTTALVRNAADDSAENEDLGYDDAMNQTNGGRRKEHVSNHCRHNRRASDVSDDSRQGRRIDDAPAQTYKVGHNSAGHR